MCGQATEPRPTVSHSALQRSLASRAQARRWRVLASLIIKYMKMRVFFW